MSAKTKNTVEKSVTLLGIFSDEIPDTASRRNTPVIVLHDTIPIGKTVSGEIVAILDSPVSTIKGKLLHLRHASGQEYALPCTGGVRAALVPGKKGKDYDTQLAKEIGKNLFVTRLPNKLGAKKIICLFDISTADK